MKFPNYLKNAFAGLGIVSLIFYTCAAADEIVSDNNDNNPPTMTGGVYQISTISDGTVEYLVALNSETGVVKTYIWNCTADGCDWLNYQGNGSFPFNDLTLTH